MTAPRKRAARKARARAWTRWAERDLNNDLMVYGSHWEGRPRSQVPGASDEGCKLIRVRIVELPTRPRGRKGKHGR